MKAGSIRIAHTGTALLMLTLATARGLWGQEPATAHPTGPTIPAISGTVVDAVTGKPVAGVDVTLRARSADGKQLRYENYRTLATGRFRFPSSVEPKAAGPFASIGEIGITVNIPFVSIARIRASPGNDWVTSDGGSDASANVLWDPRFTIKSTRAGNLEVHGPRVNNKAYFPMAVQFLRACEQAWDANCTSMDSTRNVRVPLIPVFEDASACTKIADRDLSEGCRQLQTYRAAFRHVETMAQVRADKEICNQVDGGRASKACLEHLHSYIVSAKSYEDRPPVRMEIDPVEDALILTPIAGMVATKHSLGRVDPFDETASYFATYGRQGRPLPDTAAQVSVEFIGNAEARRQRFAALLKAHPDSGKEPGHIEIFDGSPLFRWEPDWASQVIWTSGDRLITIDLNRAENYIRGGWREHDAQMAVATPEQRRALIRSYLRKYPVSN